MKSSRAKVAIVGAGNVGSTFAYSLMLKGIAREIVIIDRNLEKANGECMDLSHGASFVNPVQIRATDYDGCKGANVVVITAGANQKPGQSRIDLVRQNCEVYKDIIPKIIKYAPDSVLLVVSNPVDVLTYVTCKISGFNPNRVIGSGTALDSSRFKYLLSEHCQVDARNVHAYIIGEHGDTELPVWSHANIAGMRISEYCPICNRCKIKMNYRKELDKIFSSVKDSAYKIIEAKGSTYYAIGLALVRIVEAILRDENSVIPVSTLINDYYGINDVCLSIPCIINRNGVGKKLLLTLAEDEQKMLKKSASALKEVLKKVQT